MQGRCRPQRWVPPPVPVGFAPLILHAAVLAMGVLYYVPDLETPLNLNRTLLFVCCILGLMALDRIHGQHAQPDADVGIVVLFLLVRGVLLEFAVAFDGSGYAEFLWITIPFAAYLSVGRVAGQIGGFIAVGVLIVRLSVNHPQWYNSEQYVFDAVMFTVGTMFSLFMASVIEAHRRGRISAEALVAELEESQRMLRAYSERIVQLTASEERNRLARDIHDSLGHHLTVIAVQLEKAVRIGERDRCAVEQALSHARCAVKSAMVEVRRSVATLHEPTAAFSLTAELRALVEKTDGDDLRIRLQITGSEVGYPYHMLINLYRVAQEALTNVRKHAHAERADVSLTLDGPDVELSVADDGRGFRRSAADKGQAPRGSRLGLNGMRARLEEIGGSLLVLSAPGRGTKIVATLPGDAGPADHRGTSKELSR